MCPYFGYVHSTEREAALSLPLRLILWDRAAALGEKIRWMVQWQVWQRRKWWRAMSTGEEEDPKVVEYLAGDDERQREWDRSRRETEAQFALWFAKVKSACCETPGRMLGRPSPRGPGPTERRMRLTKTPKVEAPTQGSLPARATVPRPPDGASRLYPHNGGQQDGPAEHQVRGRTEGSQPAQRTPAGDLRPLRAQAAEKEDRIGDY